MTNVTLLQSSDSCQLAYVKNQLNQRFCIMNPANRRLLRKEVKCQQNPLPSCQLKRPVTKPHKPTGSLSIMADQNSRAMNVICYNVPESNKGSSDERRTEDILKFLSVCEASGTKIEPGDFKVAVRLGSWNTDQTDRILPMKITLRHKALRKEILDNAKQIGTKAPEPLKKVVIVKDLTPAQSASLKMKKKKRTTAGKRQPGTNCCRRWAPNRTKSWRRDWRDSHGNYTGSYILWVVENATGGAWLDTSTSPEMKEPAACTTSDLD